MPHQLKDVKDRITGQHSNNELPAATPASADPESITLEDHLHDRIPFHENRWMCLTESEAATLVLGPYAKLELSIVKAHNLLLNKLGVTDMVKTAPHPFVRVYLDDTRQNETEHVKSSRQPEWNAHCTLDITAARSMVRLQIYDQDVEDEEGKDILAGNMLQTSVVDQKKCHSLGFVEFCVGDMPYDEEIAGWLELRFPVNLVGSNIDRYQAHCSERRDSYNKRKYEESIAAEASIAHMQTRAASTDSHAIGVFHKGASMMKRLQGRHVDSGNSVDGYQYNAGELFVKMKLVRLQENTFDEYFALALIPPCLEFNAIILSDALPELDIQEAFDDAMDVKYAVLDDFVFCVASYVWYLVSWRQRWLSAMVSLILLVGSLNYDLWYVALHFIMAMLLLLNMNAGLRQDMTTSGLNAPITEKGFSIVARSRSIIQMEAFLLRAVVHRGGTVDSERELHDFVARAFRYGKPLPSLRTTLHVLAHQEWVTINKEETRIKSGTKVRINERRRATVQSVNDETVHFTYDEPPEPLDGECSIGDIVTRTVLPPIPQVMLNSKVKQSLRKLGFQIDAAKQSVILPMLKVTSDVVSWEKPLFTTLIFLYLVFRTILPTMNFLINLGKLDADEFWWVPSMVWLFRNLVSVLAVSVFVGLFVLFAEPLAWIFPASRMFFNLRYQTRSAPAIWAFYSTESGEPPESDFLMAMRKRAEDLQGQMYHATKNMATQAQAQLSRRVDVSSSPLGAPSGKNMSTWLNLGAQEHPPSPSPASPEPASAGASSPSLEEDAAKEPLLKEESLAQAPPAKDKEEKVKMGCFSRKPRKST
jgi:hypothetical protein